MDPKSLEERFEEAVKRDTFQLTVAMASLREGGASISDIADELSNLLFKRLDPYLAPNTIEEAEDNGLEEVILDYCEEIVEILLESDEEMQDLEDIPAEPN